jgi:hypothetical protein
MQRCGGIIGATLFALLPLFTGMVRSPLSIAGVMSSSDCSAASRLPALGGSFDSSETKFAWTSDAGALPQGTVCFDRLVRNRHANNKLVFDWPTGEMSSTEGIPAGGVVHYNATLSAEFETRQGPLFYGGKQDSVPTSVYREKEGSASQALKNISTANYDLALLDSLGRAHSFKFSVYSAFSPRPVENHFAYTVTNIGRSDLFIAWDTKGIDEFDKAIVALTAGKPELSFGVPAGLRVDAGKRAAFAYTATKGLIVKRTALVIYAADRKPIAFVPYPGLFPSIR